MLSLVVIKSTWPGTNMLIQDFMAMMVMMCTKRSHVTLSSVLIKATLKIWLKYSSIST